MSSPSVCIVLPVLNELDAIDPCLGSLQSQTYAGPIKVLVADGGSGDGTLERLADWSQTWPSVHVIDNPDRVQSAGIWLAANATDSEILIRADAHTTYESDYVERSVAALESDDAVAVGGPMRPGSDTWFGKAVAAVMTHPLGVGPAPFHHGLERCNVDTVYLGTFRRSDFLAVGGMRTLPSRVAEDADLYYRWRRAGRTILMDPAIKSTYQPRETAWALWKQFFRYGVGKADMLILNGEFPSARPLAPLALVVGLATAALLLPITAWPLLLLLAVWLGVLVVAMRFSPARMLAAMIMHLSYGFGLTKGLLRTRATVRSQVKANQPS